MRSARRTCWPRDTRGRLRPPRGSIFGEGRRPPSTNAQHDDNVPLLLLRSRRRDDERRPRLEIPRGEGALGARRLERRVRRRALRRGGRRRQGLHCDFSGSPPLARSLAEKQNRGRGAFLATLCVCASAFFSRGKLAPLVCWGGSPRSSLLRAPQKRHRWIPLLPALSGRRNKIAKSCVSSPSTDEIEWWKALTRFSAVPCRLQARRPRRRVWGRTTTRTRRDGPARSRPRCPPALEPRSRRRAP